MSRSGPRLILASSATTSVALEGRKPSDVPGLHRVRRGAYVEKGEWREASRRKRYELLVRGTLPALQRPAALAHESAAVLLGIPIIGAWPEQVHLIEPTAPGGRSSANVIRHGTKEPPSLVRVKGIAMTSPARTAVDLARTRSFASGLAAMDFVLRTSLATREELEAELAKTVRRQGYQRARLALLHADPRAESVGESLSRAQIVELDLPLPELQHEFFDEEGFIGRTDFWWPELKLCGEFDGLVKFGRELAASENDAREALWKEKRREDRLRRLGNSMVRWTWHEALRSETLGRLLAAAGVR